MPKGIFLMLSATLVSLGLLLQDSPRVTAGGLDEQLAVDLVRKINTTQVEFRLQNNAYVSLDQLLEHRFMADSKALLEPADRTSAALADYHLRVVATDDGQRYTVMIASQAVRCGFAVFSDEGGVIYVGKALGCDRG
jgi:hypothetical protein